MRQFPEDESDLKDAARLLAEPWMLEQLKLNPSYVSWGPHEDYMWVRSESGGWNVPAICESWTKFTADFSLNELNEAVNFYFSVVRPSRECDTCGGHGTHPDAQWISESFYEHSSPFRSAEVDQNYQRTKAYMEQSFGCHFNREIIQRGSLPPDELMERYGQPFAECCVRIMEHGGYWSDDITDDEAAALVDGGRGSCDGLKTAADFNRAEQGRGFGHDAINRWILVSQRLKRLGMPEHCPDCEGHGHIFTGPPRLDLTLWWLHPRKGCSRGIEVQNIQREELPQAYTFLREAAQRNANRFAKIPVGVVEATN